MEERATQVFLAWHQRPDFFMKLNAPIQILAWLSSTLY